MIIQQAMNVSLRTKTSIGFFIAIRKIDQSFRKYQFHKTTDCDYIAG
jgi:hypothetical protein